MLMRFFQHFVIEWLDFVDEAGQRLETQAKLEVTFWPDRLSLTLGILPIERVRGAELVILAGEKCHVYPLNESNRVSVPPHFVSQR